MQDRRTRTSVGGFCGDFKEYVILDIPLPRVIVEGSVDVGHGGLSSESQPSPAIDLSPWCRGYTMTFTFGAEPVACYCDDCQLYPERFPELSSPAQLTEEHQ